MFCIYYTVDGQKGVWCDPNIRGNRDPMTYTDKMLADKECEFLNCQYYNEGFAFSVEPHTIQ